MKKRKGQQKASKKRNNSDSLGDLSHSVLSLFQKNPTQEINYKQVSSLLMITDVKERKLVQENLINLVKAGSLKEVSKGKYKFNSLVGYVTGKVDINKSGNAYIVSDDFNDDIFVSYTNLNTALNADVVKVSLYARGKKGKIQGEVVEIIERNTTQFVGTIEKSNSYAFFIPDSHKMIYDIFIATDNLNGAKDGDKVVVEIIDWHKKSKNPSGKVSSVLGRPGEHTVEMNAILAEFNLPSDFSGDIEKAALKIKEEFSQFDYESRRDFRNITTFTIDPEDAKDFDDALSFQVLENGNYQVGVHIADVSNYIPEGSELDEEAFERATSVYLVDRVVPMLPERLSNFICSLRPNEEKLCFSVIFEMDKNAKVLNYEIAKTIINSDKRFSYEQAQEAIDTKLGEFQEEINILNELAKQLRAKRFRNGAFNFEHSEVKFVLDEKGAPIKILFKTLMQANNLIEEFMLLANRKVAEFVGMAKDPKEFVYRDHADPNSDKLESFSNFLSRYGFSLDMTSNIGLSRSLNNVITNISGKPEQNIIENLAIRAMSKAYYSTKNIGHYGLAFEYYSHFTSPIRRYPDVLVHRLLDSYLRNKAIKIDNLEQKARYCSVKEMQASQAERASIKYKQVEFMQDKIGKEYAGIISGVTEWGFFVEIKENACEGLVHIRTLNDDIYTYYREEYAIQGTYKKRVYRLGDPVNVRIISVSLQKKQIDFELVKEK